MSEPNRISSLAAVGEILQKRPTINRIILKQIGESRWEITKEDGDRPNNLHQVAERSAGKFAYERNPKRGFEALSGYDINSDEQIKVIYRIPKVVEKTKLKSFRTENNPFAMVIVRASEPEPLSLTAMADLGLGKFTLDKQFELSRQDRLKEFNAVEILNAIEKEGYYLTQVIGDITALE